MRRVGYGLLGIQLIVMLVAGAHLYTRWDVTNDFALYSQAWYLIAHGHLNPYSTVDQLPFWRNHFELIMWPMSLVYWIHSSPVDLKWLQELAAVASEAVAFRWVLDALGRHRRSIPAAPVALGFVVVLLVNPNFYQADWFDFHFQAFATLFLVLAARDLYNGRSKRALIWAAIMLLTGDVAATYAIGLGVAALVCSRETRRAGAILVVGGALWLVIISSLHANVGSDLQAGLGYLAAGSSVTIFSIVAGLFVHPGRWFLILHQRWAFILDTLTTGGLVGVAAPWALFISIVVLVPNALQANVGYIHSPFQNFPVFIVVPVGTVLVLEWTARGAACCPSGRPPTATPDRPIAWLLTKNGATGASWWPPASWASASSGSRSTPRSPSWARPSRTGSSTPRPPQMHWTRPGRRSPPTPRSSWGQPFRGAWPSGRRSTPGTPFPRSSRSPKSPCTSCSRPTTRCSRWPASSRRRPSPTPRGSRGHTSSSAAAA